MSRELEKQYAAIFNVFSSWGYEGASDGDTLEEVLQQISDTNSSYRNSSSYEILKDACENYPELAKARIKGQSWQNPKYNSETAACVFELENGEVFVTYCGTGDGGWIDNGQGASSESTGQQREAAEYFDDMARRYGWTKDDKIIVTGHSKGGNKSQYVTLMSDHRDLIDQCYSYDGQGFSPEAIEMFRGRYGEQKYQEYLNKMYAYNGNKDYVSPLLITVIPQEHITYIDTTVREEGSIKDLVFDYHMITAYFQRENGEFSSEMCPETDHKESMGELSERLSDYLMSLPKEDRESVAMVIMQLMESLEGRKVGIDGDQADLKDMIVFGSEAVIPILVQVIETSEGREVISDLLERCLERSNKDPKLAVVLLPAVIILCRVAIVLYYPIEQSLRVIRKLMEMIETLGEVYRVAVGKLRDIKDTLEKMVNDAKDRYRGWRDRADFISVDVSKIHETAQSLLNEKRVLERYAQRIRDLKRRVDFGLLTRECLYFNLTRNARELERSAEKLEKMCRALYRCQESYRRTERNVVSVYQ